MTLWQDILKTVIIGTERNALALPVRNDALGHLLMKFDKQERESQLLNAAATVTLYERAGWLPNAITQALPIAAESDDLPCCNAIAAQHLSLLLGGEFKEILPEWLAALAAAGKRVPEELLPALLTLGKSNRALREAITKVIGKRGAWLASQNPDWRFVVEAVAESGWETGSAEMRIALLKKLRATAPSRARDLLMTTWSQETPEDCATFIATFQTGLSLEDESFLETALDDRRKEIRKVAASLLACLPESELVQRMIVRVTPLITYKKKILGKDEIVVVLPEQCDKEMQRDGIEPKPTHPGIGEKAWWLQQLVSFVPLEYWEGKFNKKPEELCQSARTGEWSSSLLGGWQEAAQRSKGSTWTEALLDDQTKTGEIGQLFKLFSNLSKERQESFVLAMLKRNALLLPDNVAHWLLKDQMNFSWSKTFSLQIGILIETQLSKNENNLQLLWSGWLKKVACNFSPSSIDIITLRLIAAVKDHPAELNMIQDFISTLQFRHDMLKEITK